MPQITNGAIALDQAELTWFAENHGNTAWCVYFPGMDEITTHDRHYPGDEVKGEPFTEETVRAYLAEFDGRFGPGSPMAREVHMPSYAVALHYGKPVFGSHKHSFGDCTSCGADAEAFVENTTLRAQFADALEILSARTDSSPHFVEATMADQPTVTETRRGLIDYATHSYEQAKAYGRATRLNGPPFDAWCARNEAATFALLAAGMLRIVAEDHGEEYTAKLVALAKATEDDGENAYDANSDLMGGA